MATQPLTRPKQDQPVEKNIKELRQLYADAPQYVKTALENALPRDDVAGVGGADSPDGKRRPDRHPSGQGL